MTSSVLTKNNCVFLASTSRAWIKPETREAWRDLATQQCLQGVEVIKCYLVLMWYRRKICDSQAPKKKKNWSVKNNNCLHQRGSRVGYSFMIPIIYTQLFLVTISLLILRNYNQSRILSVTHGHRPFHIIFKPGF